LLDARYAFISAYLKGGEAKVVTPDHVARMAKTSKIRDALAIITDTDIGDYLEEVPINTFDELDECLWRYLGECIAHIEAFRSLPCDILSVLRIYIVKYDIANIKAALHGILTGKKANMISLGIIYNYGLLGELSSAKNIDAIIEVLIKCKLEDYVSLLNEYKPSKEVKSRLLAEAKLDGTYYNNLLNMTKSVKDGFILAKASFVTSGVSGGSVLAKAFGLIIDLTNLQIACRAIIEDIGLEAAECIIAGGYMLSAEVIRELLPLKLSDIPPRLEDTQYRDVAEEVSSSYDRTQSITSVEEIIDKYKFSLVKGILSPKVLSPLVIVWYLILKELEIRNLRLILKAMFDNIPLDEIRQYLVLSS